MPGGSDSLSRVYLKSRGPALIGAVLLRRPVCPGASPAKLERWSEVQTIAVLFAPLAANFAIANQSTAASHPAARPCGLRDDHPEPASGTAPASSHPLDPHRDYYRPERPRLVREDSGKEQVPGYPDRAGHRLSSPYAG